MVIVGINTNQTFQQALLTDPTFISGQFSTAYLEKQFLPLWKERISQDEPVPVSYTHLDVYKRQGSCHQ